MRTFNSRTFPLLPCLLPLTVLRFLKKKRLLNARSQLRHSAFRIRGPRKGLQHKIKGAIPHCRRLEMVAEEDQGSLENSLGDFEEIIGDRSICSKEDGVRWRIGWRTLW